MISDYITVGDLKVTLSLQGESFADPDIKRQVSTASRAIDKATRRRFYADDDNTSVRYYTPSSRRLVRIDDLIDLAEVATGHGDGTFATVLTENTDFTFEPLNAAEDGKPWTSIHSPRHRFSTRRRSVRVTGQFGWAEIPDEIVTATGILAAKLLKRAREAPFGVVTLGIDSIPVRIARSDPDVAGLIGPFIRPLVR